MSKTALIILDLINGLTESKDFKPYLDKHQTIKKANQLIAYARKNNQLIVFVKVGFSDSYAELAHRSPLFIHNKSNGWLKLSEESTKFHPALDYRSDDMVVVKHRINAFYSTSLEAILNANEIDHLILCGISTNFAVDGTARDAHDRNYKVTIAKDACGASSEENQEKSLSILSRITEIKTVDEICQYS
jgi:nicotinamidase-related amidase